MNTNIFDKVALEAELGNHTLENAPIFVLARIARRDWKNISSYARPYLDAMHELNNITDKYILDDGVSVVLYFLSNAAGWRGPFAKLIKAELKRRAANV